MAGNIKLIDSPCTTWLLNDPKSLLEITFGNLKYFYTLSLVIYFSNSKIALQKVTLPGGQKMLKETFLC